MSSISTCKNKTVPQYLEKKNAMAGNEWYYPSELTSDFSLWQLGGHVNLLKPTGYVMHKQFNIQQLYALPTLYLCVLYLSENKQRLVPLAS